MKIGGQLFTEYIMNSAGKPILWPLIGPTGKPFTREWPMAEAGPHERQDHLHHRSLWFSHGEVNGIDFWQSKGKGRIEHIKFSKISTGKPATLVAK